MPEKTKQGHLRFLDLNKKLGINEKMVRAHAQLHPNDLSKAISISASSTIVS